MIHQLSQYSVNILWNIFCFSLLPFSESNLNLILWIGSHRKDLNFHRSRNAQQIDKDKDLHKEQIEYKFKQFSEIVQSFYWQTLSAIWFDDVAAFEINCARKRWWIHCNRDKDGLKFWKLLRVDPRNCCFSIISAQCLRSLECYWIHHFLLWHQWVIQFLRKNFSKTRKS